MGYIKIAQRIYQDILATSGHFDIKDVIAIAVVNSPSYYTKKELKELALNALDEALNNGMVKMVNEGIYESVLIQEQEEDTEPTYDEEDILSNEFYFL